MTNERAITIIDDVNAYLASRSIYENDSIAGYTYRVICEALTQLKQSALELSISIPSGATNGDVIKAVFPRIKHSFTDKDSKVYILEPNDILTPILTAFDSWWNAPYKRGEKDEVSD